MNGKPILYYDQQSKSVFIARTLRELQFKAGGGRISKMYQDHRVSGRVHIGYVVGDRWFTAFTQYKGTE